MDAGPQTKMQTNTLRPRNISGPALKGLKGNEKALNDLLLGKTL